MSDNATPDTPAENTTNDARFQVDGPHHLPHKAIIQSVVRLGDDEYIVSTPAHARSAEENERQHAIDVEGAKRDLLAEAAPDEERTTTDVEGEVVPGAACWLVNFEITGTIAERDEELATQQAKKIRQLERKAGKKVLDKGERELFDALRKLDADDELGKRERAYNVRRCQTIFVEPAEPGGDTDEEGVPVHEAFRSMLSVETMKAQLVATVMQQVPGLHDCRVDFLMPIHLPLGVGTVPQTMAPTERSIIESPSLADVAGTNASKEQSRIIKP